MGAWTSFLNLFKPDRTENYDVITQQNNNWDKIDAGVKAVSDDLGNPSSASAVTGADAFSKIASLNSKTTITTTKLWANAIDILAEKNNRIICCSGWIKLNASSYTDQMPLFRLNGITLTNFVYFYDDKGDIYRVQANGEVIFHEAIIIPTDQYRFVSFAFCN